MIQNISDATTLKGFEELLSTLPIKGFVTGYRMIHYQAKSGLLVNLKTNQPLIVVNQLHNKSHIKQARAVLGNDFYSVQLAEMKEYFSAIIIRGLDNRLTAS